MSDPAKHTPGPWRADWSALNQAFNICSTHPTETLNLAEVHSFHDEGVGAPTELAKANAALIAAAPELADQLSLTILLFTNVMEQVGIDPEGTKMSISYKGKNLADVTFSEILTRGLKILAKAEGREFP